MAKVAAPEELKGDREVVIEAVTQHGRALRFASEELKHDREVVIEAVRQNGGALWYASVELNTTGTLWLRPSGRMVVRFGLLRRS